MKILRGYTKKETEAIFNKMSADEIFSMIKSGTNYKRCEYLYHKAVQHGLLDGMTSNEKLYKAIMGHSFNYILKALSEGARLTYKVDKCNMDMFEIARLVSPPRIKKFILKMLLDPSYSYRVKISNHRTPFRISISDKK